MYKIILTNSDGTPLRSKNGMVLYKTLPQGYTEMEYIENTGTGYVDTGVVAANKKFEIDLQFTSNATRQLMGISGSSSAYWGNNKGTWEKVGNSKGVATTTRCIVNYDVGNITANQVNTWIEGSTTKAVGQDSAFATAAAKTFKLFNLAGGSYNCKMKLYGVKVYDANNVLVNALVPCVNSSGVAGLYDIIAGAFRAGTSLTYGSDVRSKIPAEYQRVEYIEASGKQYIDTKYVLKTNTFTVLLTAQTTGSTSAFMTFCGFMEPTASVPRFGINQYSSKIMYGANATAYGSAANTSKHAYVFEGNGSSQSLKIDSTTYTAGSYDISSNALSMYLFARNNGTSVVNYTTGRIYSFSLMDNGREINLLPCYRKSDGVIGMYDTVNQNFYTNQGTGNFTKGADVN